MGISLHFWNLASTVNRTCISSLSLSLLPFGTYSNNEQHRWVHACIADLVHPLTPPRTEDTNIDEATQIAQEYKTWKESVPQLYEMMVEHTIAWPTLTCQWLPFLEK